MNRIDALFARLRAEGRRALMPFLTAGDPDLETTAALLDAALARGASMVELGLPYSDPVADGPVIAASYTRALRRGLKVDAVFTALKAWRAATAGDPARSAAPVVPMVSFAIVHRHGVDRFLAEAAEAGADGLIVPDLPVEEAEPLRPRFDAAGLRLALLVTPTTPPERARRIAAASTGFVYVVSVAGITGERRDLPAGLLDEVARLRAEAPVPVCIGFGIATAEQVRQLAPAADGLIVGSAIVRRVAALAEEGARREAIAAAVGDFVAELAGALT